MPPGRVVERFTNNGAEILVKLMKFAVGLAAGYVLGTRAGREKYERIVARLRMVRSHPAVQEAQQAATDLLQASTNTPTVEPVLETQGLEPAAPITAPVPRAPRRRNRSARTTPSSVAGPQAKRGEEVFPGSRGLS